ncbi:MAG: EAL domain-containing response regulator [Gammaproteobacteria bacterium]
MLKTTNLAKLKILLIDDDPIILKLISRFLSNIGVSDIATAGNGNEGLVALDSNDDLYDVILCDLNMPEMDGINFLHRLADRNYSGGLAFLSGEDERMLETSFELANSLNLNCLGTISKAQLQQNTLLKILNNYGPAESHGPKTRPNLISEEEFLQGLENNAVELYYQPKVMIDSGKVGGVEALARWKKNNNGVIAPACFIPVAEATGKMNELTYIVYKQAMSQMSEWRKVGLELDVSINVSVNTFTLPEFPAFLVKTAHDHNIEYGKIILEITESEAMADAMKCLETLMQLRMKRFGLSIDDFGTGHSSLTKLKQIPFTELKIDQTFVFNAEKNSSSRSILESTVDLARKFNMKIVAEGVETKEDWDLVKTLGCDYAQGYYCAKPMPGSALMDYIKKLK